MEVCWPSRLLLSLRMLQGTQLLVCGTANAGCVVGWEASQCPYAWPGKFHAWHPKSVGVKVSPPSLDGKIAACKYPGNHVPPPLEISLVPETLCWEGTIERGNCVLAKQTAAFAEDVAGHPAARVWDSQRGMCCLLGS